MPAKPLLSCKPTNQHTINMTTGPPKTKDDCGRMGCNQYLKSFHTTPNTNLIRVYFQATTNQSYVSNVCFWCGFPLGCLAIKPTASKWPLQNDLSLRVGRLPNVLASRWETVLPEEPVAYSGSSQSGSLGVWMNIFDQMRFTKADCHSHNVHYWQGDSEAQHNN